MNNEATNFITKISDNYIEVGDYLATKDEIRDCRWEDYHAFRITEVNPQSLTIKAEGHNTLDGLTQLWLIKDRKYGEYDSTWYYTYVPVEVELELHLPSKL